MAVNARRVRRIVAVAAGTALAAAACAWAFAGLRVAGGYTSKSICSCLYVSRRPLADCVRELEDEGMYGLRIRVDDRQRSVRAGLFGLREGLAEATADAGCVLR